MRSVAVIDIGKTNKKLAVYDEHLRPLATRQAEFAAAPGSDGIGREPVDAMWAWFKRELVSLFREQPFDAIGISTHGATQACLDCDGDLAIPVIAYDHDLGSERQAVLDRRYRALVGDEGAHQAETGSCDLPLLINPAKRLLFAKSQYREAFGKTSAILNYPQYWGFRLTGRQATEPTFSFNHTGLHDIRTRRPSSLAESLGVARMLPRRFACPWDRLGILDPTLQFELSLPPLPVAVGIHDSNAALLPYLCAEAGRDFVLLSTGTWCVAMHAVAAPDYAADELGRSILINVDALDGYQKVAILMGGQEYAAYHELIGGDHPGFEPARLDAALAEPENRILPGAFPSQFPQVAGGATEAGGRRYSLEQLRAGERPAWFAEQHRAHDLLNVSLALQTRVALEATGIGPGTAIFVEGGFRSNPTYLACLAALFPGQTVACTSLEQATAVGTALLGHAMLAGSEPRRFADHLRIEEARVAAPELEHLAPYAEAWMAAVR